MTTPLISDGVLIKRYIDGNNAAFETLLKRHRTRILSSIYLLVGDRYLAEDIFQETFIKVIHSIQNGKYNHEDKFLPWALRIARNMSIDSIRSRKRMPVVVDTDGRDVFDAMGISVNSQEDQRVAKDEIEILKQWIWELPEDQREVLILRQYADLSFKEIATLTETNINTCIGRMHYAILNLRKKMQKKYSAHKINWFRVRYMFVVNANNMAKPLSHSDLLLYFYGEADADTSAYIQANIAENPDWSIYLNELYEATSDFDRLMVSPAPTTLSIILEESDSKLYHSI